MLTSKLHILLNVNICLWCTQEQEEQEQKEQQQKSDGYNTAVLIRS